MIKSTSPTSVNKVWNRLVRWGHRRLEAAGNRLFSADDLTLLGHGWQIIPRRPGLSRRYRDPRFDTLISCPHCDGSGATDGWPCPPCWGNGRLTRHFPSTDLGGEGHDPDPLASAQ